ncbi:unnamed protein product [Mytilus edulis]|uniref:BPTI/Kunitz inhibitor domain-containing protein n=1 Tax=Mytilus edulis TaxID=6550 RepID=A0A8S3R711_MYTED|nr:unnamed protein product [Mytilus edulis]
MMIQEIISTVLLLAVIKVTGANRITIGKDAELKCKEWKKSCTEGSLCVIQHLSWPMNMSFPICVPESEISVKLRICQKPPQPGNCGARWVRWYFNTHIQKCSWFYFQGCRGNENNFKSKTECESECMPNQQTNVIQKPIIGLGSNEPVVVTQPIKSPDYSNYIDRGYLVRSHKTSGDNREVRRKRRLEKRRQKRMRKLMRKRRKSMRSKKRRREGEDDDITTTSDLMNKLVSQEISKKDKKKERRTKS